MKLLDLFCCAGGASYGYHKAGFEVTGVDLFPQKNYPFKFIQSDAIEYALAHAHEYDVIAASPPCQSYTKARTIMNRVHPDLVAPTREVLVASGKPYVIENVPLAPLIDPILLCGSMFDLRTYRHRLFESNLDLIPPAHPKHVAKVTKMGRTPVDGEFMHVVGNFSGVKLARQAMGIDWMIRNELSEAIPPAYTEYLGKQIMELI